MVTGRTGFPLSRGLIRQPRGTCNAVEKIPALAATCNVRTRRKRKLRSRLPPHPQIAELARCNRVVKSNPTELAITLHSFRTLSFRIVNSYSRYFLILNANLIIRKKEFCASSFFFKNLLNHMREREHAVVMSYMLRLNAKCILHNS